MHSRVALNSSSSASHVTANSLQSKSKEPPRWTGTTCWSASAKLCYTVNMNSPRFMQTPPIVPSQCFHCIKTKKQNNIDPEVRRSPLRLCLRWSLHILQTTCKIVIRQLCSCFPSACFVINLIWFHVDAFLLIRVALASCSRKDIPVQLPGQIAQEEFPAQNNTKLFVYIMIFLPVFPSVTSVDLLAQSALFFHSAQATHPSTHRPTHPNPLTRPPTPTHLPNPHL